MSVIQIREAQRAGARLFIVMAAISGGGKTYTALQLAYGLANGVSKKVGLLDTENRRGSLYSDILKNKKGETQPFMIGDLFPPFSPQRYIDAIKEFQKAGVEVLVIDSGSHEWEGEGGCEDIAHAPGADGKAPRNPRWNDAKREHKRFVNTALQCDMHVILCLRAREKVKLVKVRDERTGKEKTEYEPMGVMPICEKNLMFEATASMMLWNGGKEREVLKCPEDLAGIFGKAGENAEGYLVPRHGLLLRQWIDGGAQVDAELEHARNSLRTVCEGGMAALESAWGELKPAMRKKLGDEFLAELKASAQEYDAQRRNAAEGGADVADLNDAVLGGQQKGADDQ